ncbi:S-adenosyl-L-methionine-dependent methyltransferases superfamily protein [Quillaja saponaria]|uniref:Methyltransferase n=1 Tax=Quillaja saponaria TaxID=32244 RepID=A0AAD7QD50_QUISA|nr:S-adenosyl-L-methionine-dependent methyltransferases superfamily protein [Quillaja saponaria]
MATVPSLQTTTLNPLKRPLLRIFLIIALCSISYILGFYSNSSTSTTASTLSLQDHHPQKQPCLQLNVSPHNDFSLLFHFEPRHSLPLPQEPPQNLQFFEFCPKNFSHHCPCQDPLREKQFTEVKRFQKERHCPESDKKARCLIPRPVKYHRPFPWPKSRDYAWISNAPFPKLTEYKKSQNWVRLEGDLFVFPGGGTSFRRGVKGYVDEIKRIVPLKSGNIRTALDVGCGVASFGASMLDYDIMTMSITPRDIHETQVQFSLERGLPAMLGVLSTYRLPFPSRSFDMVHCSRCLVPWTAYDGIYLLEIDRILRPGGYWCGENHQIHCTQKLKTFKSPKFCTSPDADSGWYAKMKPCIFPLPDVKGLHDTSGGPVEKWPKRLTTAPPRIRNGKSAVITITTFNEDNQIWNRRVSKYGAILKSMFDGKYRNVMDMNAGLGGFAAAMVKYPVWVMNVVPFDAKNNTLGIIYERGLIGTYMNWCEAFSTYPRTYDLIHANGVFSMYMYKCDITDILLEMHRILRPMGAVIIRDHVDVIVKVKGILHRMRWSGKVSHSERGPFHPEKVLFVDNSG